MSIRAKLLLVFACIVLLIAAQGAVDYWRSTRLNSQLLASVANSSKERIGVEGMTAALREIEGTLFSESFEPTRMDAAVAKFESALALTFEATRDSIGAGESTGDETETASESRELELLQELDNKFHGFVEAADSGAGRDALRSRLTGEVVPVLEAYRVATANELAADFRRATRNVEMAESAYVTTLAIMILSGVVACFVIAGIILRPLKALVEVSDAVAEGQLHRRLLLNRSDEFAEVEVNFNRMLDELTRAHASRDDLELIARKRLHEIERFFSLSLDLLVVANLDGYFVRLSDSAKKILGYEKRELLDEPFFSFLHPDDVGATRKAMAQLLNGKPVVDHENRYRHRDGHWVSLAWNAVPMLDEGLILAIARDVTGAKVEHLHRMQINDRLLGFERALLRMRDNEPESIEVYCQLVTEEASRALGVARTSVWFLTGAGDEIVCQDLFDVTTGTHSRGMRLHRSDYPAYFDAVTTRQSFMADDVLTDPGTIELLDGYLIPNGIGAMLDVAIRSGEKLSGVLCSEHVGPGRHWEPEENRFARSVASYVMLAIEKIRRVQNEEDIRRLNEQLRERIAQRTEQLEESERSFRQIIEQVQDYAIFVLNPDGTVATWNTGASRLKGYRAEEIVGRHFSTFYLEADREAGVPDKILQKAAEEGRARSEGWRVRKDGSRFWAEVVLTANRDASGNLRGFAKVTRDLTERRRAESELRDREEQFRTAMENSAIGMALVSTKGRWMMVNRALCEIAGYTEEELLRMDFQELTHPDDMGKDIESLRKLHSGEVDVYRAEKRYLHKDGHVIWISLAASAVRDAEGNVRYFVSQIQDVSENKNAEIALRRSLEHEKRLVHEAQAGERAKSEFLAVMSHEVRTPMNGILGYADLLAGLPDLPREAREYADTIARSGASLLRILDDILDLSRLDAGALQIDRKPFSLRDLFKDIIALMSPAAAGRGIILTADVQPSLPDRFLGDAGRIRQVLLNLAGNAMKFTEDGEVTIHAARSMKERGVVKLSVRDSGCGIPAEKLEKIFEPFVQVDSSTSRQHGGAGLGLAISRRLVLLMGGSISASSVEGEGTEIVVRIPMELIDKGDAVEKVSVTIVGPDFATENPLRILVAEDDRVNRSLLVTLLRKFGYHPLTAENGEEAIRIFESENPDCILMDLQMPRMDGIDATWRIRQIEKERAVGRPSYIFALTANTSPRDRERCMDVGMNEFLNKPLKRDELARVLAEASASHRN